MRQAGEMLPDFHVRLVTESLRKLFGEMNDDVLAMLMPMLEWMEIAGGDVVVRQGGTDSDLYFVITGRLRAYGGDGPRRRRERPTPSEGPQRRALGEIVRGETIGEASFITGLPRNATVLALRDSLLARISRPNLERLVMAYPQFTLSMARLVIARQKNAGSRRGRRRPANLCLLPVTPGVDAMALGGKLAARLRGYGEVALHTSGSIEKHLGVPGIANAGKDDPELYRRLTDALDELESRHAALMFVPDASLETEWSRRCLRIADRVLLLADAAASPEPSAEEIRHLGEKRESASEQVLVLLHDGDGRPPQRTAEWLGRRAGFGISGHLHIRPALERDLARLARAQAGDAIGLVLSGGGARCFAHLGVYKALQEHGIQIDRVGGTGMGAVMGALIALDVPADELIAYAREVFAANPTGDVSMVPVTSLIHGRKLRAILEQAVEDLAGPAARVEDTWKPFYCIASNYSKAHEAVLTHGDLAKAIRASCAAPGLLPPVPIGGDLMVDGGAFNNYPIDVMGRAGATRIIGVNIARNVNESGDFDEIPDGWELAWDKLTGRRRKYRVPSLMSILMNATTLSSTARAEGPDAIADLEFRVNLPSVGILDWNAFEHAVNVGYRHACRTLEAISEDELALYRVRQPAVKPAASAERAGELASA